MTKKEMVFLKDAQNKKFTIVRAFDAPLELVWKAWTESEILDLWWAPKPYKAETKIMDFREGGLWLYSMIGPKGDRHWCRVDYKKILSGKRITDTAVFCDEEGVINEGFPAMDWQKEFSPSEDGAMVRVEIAFTREEDMETIIKMGFREGFTAGLANLDDYLSRHSETTQETLD